MLRRIARFLEQAGELDRILKRKLGAGADGKVSGVHRVAHQHHMAVAIVVVPLLAGDALEVEPGRAAQVACVRHQGEAIEMLLEQLFAERDRRVLIRLVQTVRKPDMLRTLDDEGRGVVVELVDVSLEPAVLGLLENEVESVEELVRTQPDEAIRAGDDIGLEHFRVTVADPRIDPVRSNDQIGIGVLEVGINVFLEHQFNTHLLATLLQDVEHHLAPDTDKAVAATANGVALEVQFDVVPVIERDLDRIRGHRIPLAHVVHGRIGEDHAPAKGVIRLVALYDRDLMCRIQLLHQDRKIQACGASADTHDAHAIAPSGLSDPAPCVRR